MSLNRLLIAAGLALLSIAVILYFTDAPNNLLGEVEIEAEEDLYPYAFANDASTKIYNDDGSLSYTFESKRLNHYRPDNQLENSYTAVEEPHIVVFHESEPWLIDAENARVNSDKTIVLHENVRIYNEDIKGEKTLVETERLNLDPTQKVAHTDETVTIHSSIGEMTATGMSANLETRTIRLLKEC